ncbi:MAG: hypothetical protein C4347_01975 [Patescibacteria group bacterium]
MDEFKSLLKDYVSFKTISTDKNFLNEIKNCSQWLANLFAKNKFNVKVIEGFGNPIILAEYIFDKSKKTCLIYGHYDVQPANLNEGWRNDPFVLLEDKNKFYARGVADNKGQNLIHIFSISQLKKENKLNYNIKFLIEGNEETGSEKLPLFIKKFKNLLKSDFVLISDGEIVNNIPIIDSGFRGVVNFSLIIKTANKDFHSGLYGGAIPNSVHEAIKILSKLFKNEDEIRIKDFYKGIKLKKEIIENNKKLPFNIKKFKKENNLKKLFIKNLDFYSKTGLWPTLQITGIAAGYYGEGYRNAIPAETLIKFNLRFLENQNVNELKKSIKNFFREKIPNYVNYELKFEDFAPSVSLDLKNEYIQRAKDILKSVFKKEAVFKFSGGTLPIVYYLKNILKVPQVLVPLANEDCNMHSINENFNKSLIEKGLLFSKLFFSNGK